MQLETNRITELVQNGERSTSMLYTYLYTCTPKYTGIHVYHAYLTYMQSTLCKMLGWMNHKLESRLLEELSTTSDRQK